MSNLPEETIDGQLSNDLWNNTYDLGAVMTMKGCFAEVSKQITIPRYVEIEPNPFLGTINVRWGINHGRDIKSVVLIFHKSGSIYYGCKLESKLNLLQGKTLNNSDILNIFKWLLESNVKKSNLAALAVDFKKNLAAFS